MSSKPSEFDIKLIIDYIKKLKRLKHDKDVAIELDIDPTVLAAAKHRKAFPFHDKLVEFCKRENLDIEQFYRSRILSGSTQVGIEGRLTKPMEGGYESKEEDEPSIPRIGPKLVEVRIWEWAGMGDAYALREQDYETGLEPLRTIMLPLEIVGDWRDAFEAHGDSMEPTFSEGDIVGIDFKDKTFRSGRVFAIYSAYEGYSIKRLEDQSPYGILIKSDNPSVEAYRIDHDKIEHDLQIVGRVAWICGQRKERKKG